MARNNQPAEASVGFTSIGARSLVCFWKHLATPARWLYGGALEYNKENAETEQTDGEEKFKTREIQKGA